MENSLPGLLSGDSHQFQCVGGRVSLIVWTHMRPSTTGLWYTTSRSMPTTVVATTTVAATTVGCDAGGQDHIQSTVKRITPICNDSGSNYQTDRGGGGRGGGWTLFLDVFPVYKSSDKYVTSSDVVPDGLHASYKASGLSPYR